MASQDNMAAVETESIALRLDTQSDTEEPAVDQEPDSLLLRLDTQDDDQPSPQIPDTQTSGISDCGDSQENAGPTRMEISQDDVVEDDEDVRTEKTEKPDEDRADNDIDNHGVERMISPDPPNEASELNEMDTTFVSDERSELDPRTTILSGIEPTKMPSPPPDGSDDGSDQDSNADDSENEEIRAAMSDSEDREKGPVIDLPYKEPEQLSLKEFLERRRSRRQSQNTSIKDSPVVVVAGSEDGSNSLNVPAEPEPGPSGNPKRSSKIHEEILKAAALVTPKLGKSIEATPVDQLIQKAIEMQNAETKDFQTKSRAKESIPVTDLKHLRAGLQQKIKEQRKRARAARTLRIQGHLDDEEEEEEEDMTDEDDDDIEDEETLLAKKLAKEGNPDDAEEEGDQGEEEAEEEQETAADEFDDDEAAEDELEQDEDSDVEELTERRKSQNRKKRRKNAVKDSDDEGEEEEDADNENDDLNLRLDEDDDASFMHLSQTQRPKVQKKKENDILDLQMDQDSKEDVDDLLALCSGKFATQKTSNKEDEDDDEEGEEEAEEGGIEEEEAEEGGIEEEEAEEEGIEEDQGDAEHNEEEEDDQEEVLPKAKAGRNEFFEGEAELSGSDVGSDGEDEDDGMTEEEKKKLLKELIHENPGISEEELQEQVTKLHFKQLLDEDRKELRLMKELLLADGDLHTDGPGRERTFKWTNLGNDFVGGNDNDDSGDSDQDETEEEAKWKARRLEREKQKLQATEEDFESIENRKKFSLHKSPSIKAATNDEIVVPKILKETNTAVRVGPLPRKSQEQKKTFTGGFLNMNGNVLQKIAEKVKGTNKDKEGSQTTRNFVFRAVDKAEDNKASKRPITEAASEPKIKRTKIDKASALTGSSLQANNSKRSIFNKF